MGHALWQVLDAPPPYTEHLTDLGIPIVADLPGVGQNMQDHNMVPLMAPARHGHGYFREDRGLRLVWNALR